MEMTLEQQKALARARARLRIQQGGGREPSLEWSDVPRQALENFPASAGNFASSLVQPFLHPVQTAQTLGDLGAGAIREGARKVLPESAFNAIEGIDPNPQAAERASATAGAVGDFYKDRYGSVEGFKRALATDPIGVASDASTVLTAGAGAARSALGQTSRVAKALDTASSVTNPLTVVEKGTKIATKGAGIGSKHILGMTTGTSAEAVGEAYKAGRKGGQYNRAFKDNLRGHEGQDAVIGEARQAIGNIVDARRRNYQADMASVKANKTPINFLPIEQRFQDLVDSLYEGGHQTVSDATISKVREIGKAVDEWSKDPAMHTAGGLDALKKRVDDFMPSFSDKTANLERVVTATRNAVKDAIVAQAPQYAKAMEGYEKSKNAQREIEQALSLGRKNSTDTTLRKLQSLTRNNANTNYGGRMQSADLLKQAGADTLMPRLAGQSLSAALPRGILKALLGGGAIAGAAFGSVNPAVLAALPLASPRLVGEATNVAGALARGLSRVPRPTKEQLLLLRLLGGAARTGQQ